EAMRVYREDGRLAPGDELGSGAGLVAGCIHQLRILSGRAGGAADGLGPGLDLADDLDAPMSEIGSDFVRDLGALDAAALPPPGEAFVDPAGKTAGAAADDRRKGPGRWHVRRYTCRRPQSPVVPRGRPPSGRPAQSSNCRV